MRPDLIWCPGMYASGSTWLFNAVLQVAAATRSGAPVFSYFIAPGSASAFATPADAPSSIHVVKSHEVDAAMERTLGEDAKAIFVTVRDPHDAVHSVMTSMKREFASALDLVAGSAELCARVAQIPRARLLRYESGFVDEQVTLDELAAACGGPWSALQREAIFAGTRRKAIEKFIAELPQRPGTLWSPSKEDALDPVTHWHLYHAHRTGEIGRGRRDLAPQQVERIQSRLAGWMAEMGYA